MTVSRWIILRMRNVSDKCCRGNQNTHYYVEQLFFFENPVIYEIMLKKLGRSGALRAAQIRLHALKHTPAPVHQYTQFCNTFSLSLHQWFRERASVLRCTYILSHYEFCVTLRPVRSLRRATGNPLRAWRGGGRGWGASSCWIPEF